MSDCSLISRYSLNGVSDSDEAVLTTYFRGVLTPSGRFYMPLLNVRVVSDRSIWLLYQVTSYVEDLQLVPAAVVPPRLHKHMLINYLGLADGLKGLGVRFAVSKTSDSETGFTFVVLTAVESEPGRSMQDFARKVLTRLRR